MYTVKLGPNSLTLEYKGQQVLGARTRLITIDKPGETIKVLVAQDPSSDYFLVPDLVNYQEVVFTNLDAFVEGGMALHKFQLAEQGLQPVSEAVEYKSFDYGSLDFVPMSYVEALKDFTRLGVVSNLGQPKHADSPKTA